MNSDFFLGIGEMPSHSDKEQTKTFSLQINVFLSIPVLWLNSIVKNSVLNF